MTWLGIDFTLGVTIRGWRDLHRMLLAPLGVPGSRVPLLGQHWGPH